MALKGVPNANPINSSGGAVGSKVFAPTTVVGTLIKFWKLNSPFIFGRPVDLISFIFYSS